MDLEAEAVAEAVTERKAGLRELRAHGGVDGFSRRARADERERELLRMEHGVVNGALALACMADDDRARDVGVIAFVNRAVVHRDEIAVFQNFVRRNAMWQRAAQPRRDDRCERRPFRAVRAHERLHVRRNIEFRHARLHEIEHVVKRRIGNLTRLADTGNLLCVLDLAQRAEVK